MRLIKPDCNATGAFPARFYLSFTNPRLGIKWIQIFYHCVGRCWWVVIVFLYFLDVLVWVALLLAKVHRTEVKKRNISYPRLSQRPCWSYLISARKLPQNNDITTIPQSTLHATPRTQQRKTKTFNVKKQYSKIQQSHQQQSRANWEKKPTKISTTTMVSTSIPVPNYNCINTRVAIFYLKKTKKQRYQQQPWYHQ